MEQLPVSPDATQVRLVDTGDRVLTANRCRNNLEFAEMLKQTVLPSDQRDDQIKSLQVSGGEREQVLHHAAPYVSSTSYEELEVAWASDVEDDDEDMDGGGVLSGAAGGAMSPVSRRKEEKSVGRLYVLPPSGMDGSSPDDEGSAPSGRGSSPSGRNLGTGTGWLIHIGPVSQTSMWSDQCVKCRKICAPVVHVTVSNLS